MDNKNDGGRVEIKEIKLSSGGPCIYAKAIFMDGTVSGLIQCVGQSDEELKKELINSVKTGRNDCKQFIDGIVGRQNDR